MIVGTEWLIEAEGCEAAKLREARTLQSVFEMLIRDLELKIIGEQIWHKFEGAGGVTGLVMLTESHIACHTYPEHNIATFNLYCCRRRPIWSWKESLIEILGAKQVSVRKIERGSKFSDNAKIQRLNSKIAGGKI
jgi:S-adenosylmethionine decarboxylase